jgi:hypothetical protein
LDDAGGFTDAFKVRDFGGATEEGEGETERFGAEIARGFLENGTSEAERGFSFFHEGAVEEVSRLGGEEFLSFAGEECGATDGINGGGSEDFDGGEEDGAETVTEIGVGVVAFVFAPGLLKLGEVGAEGVAAEGEQRAEKGEAIEGDGGLHAGEAIDARAAEEAEEDGFSLIIRVVGEDDGGGVGGCGDGAQGAEAGGARGGFAGGFRESETFGDAGEIERGGESADEGGIGRGGGAADAVVDVGDLKRPVPMVGAIDGVEEAKQGDGVGTAGDGEEELGVLGQQVVAVKRLVEQLCNTAGRRHLNSDRQVLPLVLFSQTIAEDHGVDTILGNSDGGLFESVEHGGEIYKIFDGCTFQNGERGKRSHSFALSDFSISSPIDEDVLNVEFFGERNGVGFALIER